MLTIRNLKAGYDGKAVIDLASLTLNTGEHGLILGKSGSGKTTLLYAIAGLLQPITGDIILDEINLATMRGAARDAVRGRHIGIIYQTLHMVPALSIVQNIMLAQYAAGLPQDVPKAERLLAQLGLIDQRHKKPSALSQGQQQRAAIARAAITMPKLLVCDEPTSALDDTSCAAVMTLLLDVAKTADASLIVATHDARIQHHFTKTITLGA